MKPTIFSSDATVFTNNGIGKLSPLSCIVTEERNGEYELKMTYPFQGPWVDAIDYRAIICAKPSPNKDPQPFRIYRIVKSITGVLTVYARHLSYDLSDIICMPFDTTTLDSALQCVSLYSSTNNPYTFWTDVGATMKLEVTTPVSVRSVLGELLDAVGVGELEWDNYSVKWWRQRGKNNGVEIRYGKNMTSFEQDSNCSNVYTGIYPYYYDSKGNYVEIDGCIINATGTYTYSKILPVDLTDYFTELDEGETPTKDTELAYGEIPTKAQLLSVAQAYLQANNIGIPSVSIDVNFVQLSKSEEYKDYALLEKVDLCDEVKVVFPQMNVSALAEVVATEYNVLTDSYDSLTLGEIKQSYVSIQSNWQQGVLTSMNQAAQKLESRIDQTAEAITLQVSKSYVTNDALGNKLGDYYTKAETASEIQATANTITLSVSGRYATKTEVSDGISNTLTEAQRYTDSKIVVSENSIISTVSDTYITKSTAANNIATAKNEAISSANSTTDEKLKGYATTSYVSTIEQKANSIKLSVDAVSGDVTRAQNTADGASSAASTAQNAANTAQNTANDAKGAANTAQNSANDAKNIANSKVSPNGVRNAFAYSDSSSITISTGCITFESRTIVINASNFWIDANGNATFAGNITGGTINGASVFLGNSSRYIYMTPDGFYSYGPEYALTDGTTMSRNGTFFTGKAYYDGGLFGGYLRIDLVQGMALNVYGG